MQIKRRAVTAGVTFFLAAATGHVMQNGDMISGLFRSSQAETAPKLAAAVVSTEVKTAKTASLPATKKATEVAVAMHAENHFPDLPSVDPSPFNSGILLAARIDKLDEGYTRPETDADANYSVFGIACSESTLAVEPTARAMLRVTLAAPCFPNERLTISHAGLAFTTSTDVAGDLEVMIPAMASEAEINVRFSSGTSVAATQSVTGLDSLNRTAVLWQGASGLHLHAFENGAEFGGVGHVSASAPRDRATSDGGFLTVLGDPAVDHPILAEVYSAPLVTQVDELQIEAVVTADTCGQPLFGEVLRSNRGAPLVAEEISFEMPDCDSVGDLLVMSIATEAPLPDEVVLSSN